MIKLTNRQKVDGGFSFVDQDGQVITDPAVLEGWTASFESSDPNVVAIAPLESNPDDPFNRTFTSGQNGSATITATVTPPGGEAQVSTESVEVVNSAPGQPVFTLGTPRDE